MSPRAKPGANEYGETALGREQLRAQGKTSLLNA